MKRRKHTPNDLPDNAARFIRGLQKYLYRRRYSVAIILIAIILIFLFFGFIRIAFFFVTFIILNIFVSYLAKTIPRFTTSLELTLFGTVLMGVSYGSRIGAVFGLLSAILYYYGAHRFSYFIIIFAPLYAVVGIIAPLLTGYEIFTIGMICALGYTIISSILVIIIFNAKIDKTLGFAFINTVWNFVIFKYIAPLIIFLM
ncbi:MAG: hypothetical protein ACMXYE_00885 [Candidatus Woesearchaeota archaeon]